MDTYNEADEEKAPLLPPVNPSSVPFYSSVEGHSHQNECINDEKVIVSGSDVLLHTDKILLHQDALNDFSVSVGQFEQKQTSVVTIFAIWNTMLGTSILTMPWALQQAGFAVGIVLILIMAGVCFYTAYLVIHTQSLLGIDNLRMEFSDVCRFLLGSWAERISCFFSVFSLLGAVIIYWVLMSNFLFNTVTYIYNDGQPSSNLSSGNNSSFTDVYLNSENSNSTKNDELFSEIWNLNYTPLFLIILIAPLINFRSPTFFTKFNALGIVSAVFIMIFVIIKASMWGLNVTFERSDEDNYIPVFQWKFPELAGTLMLAYFIHNCVTSIMRNQRKMENNVRDLVIAYCLVALTYMLVGITFLISFPQRKYLIEDNLLNNFASSDTLTFVARLFLLFQMMTVFPLLIYIIRIQLFTQFFHSREPNMIFILTLNLVLITIGVLFAIYYPHIGQLIRYTGALCGVTYAFALPCLAYLMALRLQGRLTTQKIMIHAFIITLGVINFVAQFIPF